MIVGTHSALSTKRFLRLAALCISYLLVGLPLTLLSTYTNLKEGGSYFDYSWDYLHSAVGHPLTAHPLPSTDPCSLPQWKLVPTVSTTGKFSLGAWASIVAGIMFSAAFGFGEEARSVYSQLGRALGLTRRRDQSRSAPGSPHSHLTQVSFKQAT